MTTLAAALTNSATEMRVNAAVADPAEYYTIDSEVIQVAAASTTVQDGFSPSRTVDDTLWQIAERGVGATAAASHLSGATLTPFPGAGGGAAEEGTVVEQLTGTETEYGHLYRGDEDPEIDFAAELEVGDLWIDTTGGIPYQHKVYNGGPGWDIAPMVAKDALGVIIGSLAMSPIDGSLAFQANIAGSGAPDDVTITFDGTSKIILMQAGVLGTGLSINPDGATHIGSAVASVDIGADGSVLIIGAAGGIEISAAGVVTLPSAILTSLPTADPTVAGQLWNDTGTVKVSAG